MKILFVYCDINVRGGARSYPFGIGMVSAMLKRHGHESRMHYMFGRYAAAPLQACIADYRPDVLAFSAVSPEYQYVKRIFLDLQPFPAVTILGGHHATMAPECLEEIKGLDAICVGEGENPMLELVEALKERRPIKDIPGLHVKVGGEQIVRTPARPFIQNLDDLPFADREIMDYQAIIDSDFSTALFMFSRGCPYDCTFCSNHALRATQSGAYVRFRSAGNCLAEVREVGRRYRVKALYFNDDCFTARKDFVDEFCAAYPREFSLPFDINARPESLNDALCRQLKEAGCRRVSIGIEQGSEAFRRDVLGRNQSNARIEAAFASCRRAGLKVKSFNIVGFPRETPELFRETVELNARINPDSTIISVFEPYPGTRLAEICVEKGFCDKARMMDGYLGRMDTILNLPTFSRKEILRCFRNFGYEVYIKHSLLKALSHKFYYAPFGQFMLRIIEPFKNLIRRLVMGV